MDILGRQLSVRRALYLDGIELGRNPLCYARAERRRLRVAIHFRGRGSRSSRFILHFMALVYSMESPPSTAYYPLTIPLS